MAVPSRKNRMMQNIIKTQESKKKDNAKELPKKEVSKEEHEERLNKLRELGLIK